jgi:hypothetical protein
MDRMLAIVIAVETYAPFAQWIRFDLQTAILQSAIESIRKKGMTPQQTNEFIAKLEAILHKEAKLVTLNSAER